MQVYLLSGWIRNGMIKEFMLFGKERVYEYGYGYPVDE